MKVTIEGTAEEMFEVAELIVYGRASRDSVRGPKDRDTPTRNVGDDVPNRFREEGV